MPLSTVEDADDALAAAAISCLSRTSYGLRSMRPRSRLRPRAPRKPVLMLVDAEHVGAEIADERHRVEAEHAAGHEHVDARCVGERGRDQEAVGDDDELLLAGAARARGSTRWCSSRARRPRLPRPSRRGGGDRLLAARPRGGDASRSRARTGCAASGRAPPRTRATRPWRASSERSLRTVTSETANVFRKFRNVNGIAALEHAQDCAACARPATDSRRPGTYSSLAGTEIPRGTRGDLTTGFVRRL